MTTKETRVMIGECQVILDEVTWKKTNAENPADCPSYFLLGQAEISWHPSSLPYGGQSVELPVGCWRDTDDDQVEWCAANEGAKAIEACVGITDPEGDTRGSFARLAWPEECEQLGSAICAALRAAELAGAAGER